MTILHNIALIISAFSFSAYYALSASGDSARYHRAYFSARLSCISVSIITSTAENYFTTWFQLILKLSIRFKVRSVLLRTHGDSCCINVNSLCEQVLTSCQGIFQTSSLLFQIVITAQLDSKLGMMGVVTLHVRV